MATINFLLLPELINITDPSLFSEIDKYLIAHNLFFLFMTLVILFKAEWKYIDDITDIIDEPQIFLFTLQIENLDSKEDVKDFQRLIKMVKPLESILIGYSNIFDLKDYISYRNKLI